MPLSQLPSFVTGGLTWKGVWDANTNTPTLTSSIGTTGDTYKISVAGTTSLDGIADWGVSDFVIFNGSEWEKIDNTDAVTSVFGRVGSVVANSGDYTAAQVTNAFDKTVDDTDDITEGINKFVTVGDITKLGNLSGVNTGDNIQATEAITGIAEIATQAEVHTGTDDLRFITPLKLESEKGIANGIAGLDANGNIDLNLLPNSTVSSVISFGKDDTYHVNTTSASYRRVGTFIYAGSDEIGTIQKIRVNAWRSGGTGLAIRIYDPANRNVIAEIASLTSLDDLNIQDMGSITNVPTDLSILELQMKRVGGGAKAYCSSLELLFY